MKDIFWKLEKLGRVRLSEHFYMRQFLYSEIGAAYGILNVPDDPDLAIETGTQLCEQILEPLAAKFGPIVVRSGFRSARLNDFGARNGLKCASNEKNFAYHIWDHRDAAGHKGAAACVVIPSFNANATERDSWKQLAWYIHDKLSYHRLTFFSLDNAFNVGWHEKPRREIYSRMPKPHWFLR
ncbi:hypothetical protein OF122_03600 [Pelagibacterium flavum]|uniref:Peptidase M15A C-terminal domain-containing protein n=1 Tax=Pelagibacterium flavum TaxID=2984530 RepID=A0ABY6IQH6_9HYPH|nr:hypothetical protein [Pelagibacterium sp. YIM 151497]UYQ72871.1 hypothetical protein OF122_03600 [Pelagibacterium sp. YIM 151497]